MRISSNFALETALDLVAAVSFVSVPGLFGRPFQVLSRLFETRGWSGSEWTRRYTAALVRKVSKDYVDTQRSEAALPSEEVATGSSICLSTAYVPRRAQASCDHTATRTGRYVARLPAENSFETVRF